MGFRWCLLSSKILGGTAKFSQIAVIALGLAVIAATSAAAGDLSAQPTDAISVTGTPTHLLPQDQATGGHEWYSGFHMSGYASQTFGMWQNPTALREYTRSRNNLATSRTLLSGRRKLPAEREQHFLRPPMVRLRAALFVQQREQCGLWCGECEPCQLRPFHEWLL